MGMPHKRCANQPQPQFIEVGMARRLDVATGDAPSRYSWSSGSHYSWLFAGRYSWLRKLIRVEMATLQNLVKAQQQDCS
jgi:hypothetical protein